MQQFYRIDEGAASLESLSARQQALVRSAITYNSLIQPGRTLAYHAYMGEKWQYPRLTDTSTLNGSLTTDAGLKPLCTLRVTSTVAPTSEFSPHFFAGDEQLVDRNVRHILLTPDDATDDDVQLHNGTDRAQRLYRSLELNHPVLLDRIRERQRRKRERTGLSPIKPYDPPTVERINSEEPHHPFIERKPGPTVPGAPKAVIVGMHWLQAGGAERWAARTVELVRQAGMLPVVVTDRDSHQPWILNPEFEGALVLCLTMPIQDRIGDNPLLRALFEQFDVRGVLVHHCQWLYDALWRIKKYYPSVPVMDSLHIVEYRFHGGYPSEAVRNDAWIDTHHVISPQLEHWLVEGHGISADKVVDAPLVDLTTGEGAPVFKPRREPGKLTVSFVGRSTRQKRPDAFLLLAKELERKAPGAFRFVLHGGGELDTELRTMVGRYGLDGCVEFRTMGVPVSRTYADSDVLVISSVNEGITLTTFEALAAGVPVLSSNVGSQDTVIPSAGLLPRESAPFAREGATRLMSLSADESAREQLWKDEQALVAQFSRLETADHFFSRTLTKWSE